MDEFVNLRFESGSCIGTYPRDPSTPLCVAQDDIP
jgi:hypothetical protein